MVFPVTACGKDRAEEIGTAWGAETIPAADTIESTQETAAVPDSEAGGPEEETIIRVEFDLENKTVILNSGYEMPVNGLGTYSLHGDECIASVKSALSNGVRLIDTASAYGNEEEVGQAIREAVSEGIIQREDVFVTTKIYPGSEMENPNQSIQDCIDRLDIGYVDYYLLHNVNGMRYQQVIRDTHMFDYLKKWKEEGKIRHIAFSFHDSADVLDRILTEHPEVEAVQIALNYIDRNAYFVQAKACYEVIRKHGRQVIIMEPVKGGMLAKVPEEAEKLMEAENPGASAASWAIRYAAELDGVLAVLSGMSTLDQVKDNVSFMKEFQPLNEREKDILKQTVRIFRESGPAGTADFTKYEKISPRGISVAAILDCYNNCMLQPVPTFGAEHNYFSSEKAKHGLHKEDLCIPGDVILEDGTDATELVHKAEEFLGESAFFQYEF